MFRKSFTLFHGWLFWPAAEASSFSEQPVERCWEPLYSYYVIVTMHTIWKTTTLGLLLSETHRESMQKKQFRNVFPPCCLAAVRWLMLWEPRDVISFPPPTALLCCEFFFLFVLGGGVEKLGIVAKKFIKHVSSSLIDHKIDPTAFSRRQKRGF